MDIPLETFKIIPFPFLLKPHSKASLIVPPCAPIPGAKNHTSGKTALTFLNASGSFPATTSPIFFPQVNISFAS